MTRSNRVKLIAQILKKHFRNLSTGKTIEVAFEIMESLDEDIERVEVNPDERISQRNVK